MTFNRRKVREGSAAARGPGALPFPPSCAAQSEPIRIGLLTIKTGRARLGGIDMERGPDHFSRRKNYTLGGRKVTLTGRRHGRRAGAGAHQDAGAGGARARAGGGRPAGGVRGARDGRLHPQRADSDAADRRRRGHDAAQGESLVRARHVDVRAMLVSDRRLLRRRP
jgi:hypothetical protein